MTYCGRRVGESCFNQLQDQHVFLDKLKKLTLHHGGVNIERRIVDFTHCQQRGRAVDNTAKGVEKLNYSLSMMSLRIITVVNWRIGTIYWKKFQSLSFYNRCLYNYEGQSLNKSGVYTGGFQKGISDAGFQIGDFKTRLSI